MGNYSWGGFISNSDKSKAITFAVGFTLIELVTTILIISIVSAIAMTKLPGKGINLAAQAEQLVNDIRYTQSLSMTRGQRYRINFAANSYSITSLDGSITMPNPVTGQTTIPFDTGLSLSSFPAFIAFNGVGVPFDSAGVALAAEATLSLVADTEVKTILISPETGRVLVQ